MTRRRTLTVTALAVLGIAAAGTVETQRKLIWNTTASAPVGFYTVEPADPIAVPQLVAVMPPEPLAGFLAGRG
jgi:type IV secretory pathway protease TraF